MLTQQLFLALRRDRTRIRAKMGHLTEHAMGPLSAYDTIAANSPLGTVTRRYATKICRFSEYFSRFLIILFAALEQLSGTNGEFSRITFLG